MKLEIDVKQTVWY